VKRFLRELIGFLLIQVSYVFKTDKEGILSIYLHYPSKSLFEKIIKWLVSKGYRFISVTELENSIKSKSVTGKMVFVSLDDGWRSNLELVDLIEKYNVPLTIFIPTEAVEEGNYWWEYASIKGQEEYTGIKRREDFKKLPENEFREKIAILKQHYTLPRSCITLEELKILDKHILITLGSHTVTHPVLDRCSAESQKIELSESKRILGQWLNKEVEYFSYPNGDFDEKTIEIARECGYRLCFTIKPGKIDVNNINPYLIPRNAMYENAGIFENTSKILGIWQRITPEGIKR